MEDFELSNITKMLAKPELLAKTVKSFPAGRRMFSQIVRHPSPHVRFYLVACVEPVAKKAYYVKDVWKLYSQGVSIKQIAGLLGMSESYAYKLLKEAGKLIK